MPKPKQSSISPSAQAAIGRALEQMGWEGLGRQPQPQRGSPDDVMNLKNRKAMLDAAIAEQFRETRSAIPSIKGAIALTKSNQDAMFKRYADDANDQPKGQAITAPAGMDDEYQAYQRILADQRMALENTRTRKAQAENRSSYSGTGPNGQSFTRLTPPGELQTALADTVQRLEPQRTNPYADMDLAILNGIQEVAQRGELGGTPQVVDDLRPTLPAATQGSREQRVRAIIKLLRANGVQGVPEVFEDGSIRLPSSRRLPGVLI